MNCKSWGHVQIPGRKDEYRANTSCSVLFLCQVPKAQIHIEKYLLDPMIHALATRAAVKSQTAGAHNPRAAQITPEAVLLTTKEVQQITK